MTRLVALLRRIRRWVGARWHALGRRLFPRVQDTLVAPAKRNEFVVVHLLDGYPTEIYRGPHFGHALVEWGVLQTDARYAGELQFWKNGKLRDSRADHLTES